RRQTDCSRPALKNRGGRVSTTDRTFEPSAVIAVLLAACAGSVDTLAFFGVGRAFAGIVTGNVVTVGYGLANGSGELVRPALTATVGCIVGETVCSVFLRRGLRPTVVLAAEFVLLVCAFGIWLGADAHPHGSTSLVLLGLLSFSLGAQSMWALRIHQTTTYFTGMLTNAIDAASGSSWAKIRVSLRQLAALIAGALAGGLMLHEARAATPVIPLVL